MNFSWNWPLNFLCFRVYACNLPSKTAQTLAFTVHEPRSSRFSLSTFHGRRDRVQLFTIYKTRRPFTEKTWFRFMKLNVNYDVKRISTERYTTVLKRLRDRKERKLNFKLLFYFELWRGAKFIELYQSIRVNGDLIIHAIVHSCCGLRNFYVETKRDKISLYRKRSPLFVSPREAKIIFYFSFETV